jgi:hypothetical protein
MARHACVLAGALALGVGAGGGVAQAGGLDDFGWGPRYNNHLSQYDGRPLGPPLTAFGPAQGLDDGDPRSFYTPRYQYYDGRLIVTGPDAYAPSRKARRRHR